MGLCPFSRTWQYDGMKLLLRILIPAAALYVAHLLVSGIELNGSSGWKKAGTLIVVALIFGLVNAVLKPIIKTIGCLFYVLTLGLIGLVVNGLLLWLCSWVAGKRQAAIPHHRILAGLLGRHHCRHRGWLLNLIFDERGASDQQ